MSEEKDQNKKKITKTNSGLRAEGDFDEVVKTAEEVEKAIESDNEISQDSVDDFKDWRPQKEDQDLDIKSKTVEKASIDKKKSEKNTEGVKKDLEEAKANFKQGIEKENSDGEVVEGSKKAARPFLSKLFAGLRKIEKTLYSKLMLKFNPYFFDTEKISADLRKKKNGNYRMDVNISEDEPRENLQSELEDK